MHIYVYMTAQAVAVQSYLDYLDSSWLPEDQTPVLPIFVKNSSNNNNSKTLTEGKIFYLLVYSKTCSRTLHISHGPGVVAALRRNQSRPAMHRSVCNSLTFPSSYLWPEVEV